MPVQPKWNIYEAALLLQAYIQILQGKETAREAICRVSDQLRLMAINNGIEIDEIFRNVNGITFQMKSMESAYKGYTVVMPASKLFLEVVSIYKNEKYRYREILKEAQRMLEANDNIQENEFFSWLSKRVTVTQISDIGKVFSEIDSFCVSRKIIPKPLLLLDDISQIKRVRNTIEQNSIFRFNHKHDLKKMTLGIKHYIEFLEQKKDMEHCNDKSEIIESENETFERSDSDENVTVKNNKDALTEWMACNGMAEATIRSYVSAIKKCGEFALNSGISNVDVFSLSEAKEIQELRTKLFADSQFELLNEQQHNRFSAALAKYELFCSNAGVRRKEKCYEEKNPTLYRRLQSAAKVYTNPDGISVERIKTIIGYEGNVEDIIEILEGVSWAYKIDNDTYTFSNKSKKVRTESIGKTQVVESEPNDFDKELFKKVLMLRFQGGLQFDAVDFENFKETCEIYSDEKLIFSDEDLEKRLRYCGILYKDRLFPAEGIIDNDSKVKLFEYIENSFSSGKSVLYYKSIFSDLSDVFAYCFSLTDEKMLKAYIEYESEKGKYHFFTDYMSVEKNVKVDHAAEITEYLLSSGKPLSFDDIYAGLSHISSDLIYREIQTNPNFLRNEKSHYFHIGIFELSHDEADLIKKYIREEIEENGYAIWSRIFLRIQREMPVFLENNLYLSSLGIRNALAKTLGDRFNFDSEVICENDKHLSMGDVFALYARHHAPFSDIDLYNFSKEVGTIIYFWAVAEETVRVSKDLFVPKDKKKFDVVATDKALDTYLSDGYILAKDVDSFLVFPNVGYEWNAYLLESYLMHYSKKYTLVNNGTSLNNVAGAIVKQGGIFTEFVDICSDILANNDVELKKDSALDYLASQNLITRRSYRDIDVAITKARQIRNRKG